MVTILTYSRALGLRGRASRAPLAAETDLDAARNRLGVYADLSADAAAPAPDAQIGVVFNRPTPIGVT
jgi:hypothetical protein